MLKLYGKEFKSRFMLGTARYLSPQIMYDAIKQSGVEIVTVSLRRQAPENLGGAQFWNIIKSMQLHILPNTAGCFSVQDAVATAKMAREFFQTNWIKLELIGDEYTLQPNPILLLEAARQLCAEGFAVFPYMTEDLVIAKELIKIGCEVLMPWAAPIGSGKGLLNAEALTLLRRSFPDISIIVDAGIGAPSHAAYALELGLDGVLLNTAVACAHDPVNMSRAFALAIEAGRSAYLAGLMPISANATASTPAIGIPFS